ncbi:MAG: protein kinase [Candidatus Eremiobacteraeota bacterium]|nr:protein kinase [Candidatus Eremiobacteraeota bacterium]
MSHPRHLLDRYLLHEVVGRGGMGEVLRATHRASGEMVAIKALHFDLAPDPSMVERFLREGEALRRLSHPNIVRCRESFESEGRFYLILDYVGGGSLRGALRSGPVAPNLALNWMLDIADALTRAHRLQIVHRDLKPDNILLSEDGQARLTDFGVAHLGGAWAPLTHMGTALGTVNYMSPEACQGLPATPDHDLWAFGVTLYELLTGRSPFSGDGPGATILAILSQPPHALPDSCPQDLRDLLGRLLAREPEQRFGSMREVALALERLSEPALLSASPAARPEEVAPVTESLPGFLVDLEPGEILWKQGDPSSFVAVIEEGAMEVIGASQDGGTTVFTVLHRGEILGEMSCLDGKSHSGTVRARGQTRIRRLGRSEFIQWIRSDPERMQTILLMQADRLRRVASRLVHSRSSLKRRLAQRLLESEESRFCTQELAQQLQVKPASLSKSIGQLVREGGLEKVGTTLYILSRERLQESLS